MYSYDLGFMGEPQDNLYYVLNEMLRVRNVAKMTAWKPFVYHLLNALAKLPPSKGTTVYRGLDSDSTKFVKEKYELGTKIHWSGFTSIDFATAKKFAGTKGIIFKIASLSGVSISHYSVNVAENEILLSANAEFIVTKGYYQDDSSGYYFVEPTELAKSATVIF